MIKSLGVPGGVYKIVTTALPMIIEPSGTMADNGVFTRGTSLPATFANALSYFAAGAIFAGSAAGWYYSKSTTTAAGTVYSNYPYSSGQPTIPTSPVAPASTGPGAYTGVTTTQTALSWTIPGGSLGPRGQMLFSCGISFPNNANNKTLSGFIGAGQFVGTTQTANLSFRSLFMMANEDLQSVQTVGQNPGATGASPSQLAVDMSVNQILAIKLQMAVATDYLIQDYVTLLGIPG